MDAILDPELAGVFAHEAVGHASEGDLVHEGNSVLSGKIGERIGNNLITIVDDPSLHEFGFDPVDAEGCQGWEDRQLLTGGLSVPTCITGKRLHRSETGFAGHARAMPW